MHTSIIMIGVIFALIVVVHILFRIIKFTIIVFLLGAASIGIQEYLGIDLLGKIGMHF